MTLPRLWHNLNIMYSKHVLGRLGEQIIFDLLDGCEWTNHFKDAQQTYDIIWDGIKIDVKTTKFRIRKGFQTTLYSSKISKDILFVIVGITEERNYFWVRPHRGASSVFLRIEDAVSEKELKLEIKKVWESIS